MVSVIPKYKNDGCRKRKMSEAEVPSDYCAHIAPSSVDENSEDSYSQCSKKPRNFECSIKRRITRENVLYRLRNREMGARANSNHLVQQRKIHLSVLPNATFSNIEKPACFLRKFSPDGRYLIAFSSNQAGLEIYLYMGISRANVLLNGFVEGNNASSVSAKFAVDNKMEMEHLVVNLRKTLFNKLFKLRHAPTLTNENEQLNRECSLFTADSKYVIVVASLLTVDEQVRHYEIYRNNESLVLSQQNPLEDYWIYCVHLDSGLVTDTKVFRCDKIYLAHNQGLSLYDRTLAVLSVQHQTVHLFHISEEGILTETLKIGRFVFDDDEWVMSDSKGAFHGSRGASGVLPRAFPVHPAADPLFTALKQRLLSFLYWQAANVAGVKERAYAIRNFCRNFDFYVRLRMWRMQLLDNDNLLLRYATEEVVGCRTEFTQQIYYFVFYNVSSAKIIAVYENVDERLLDIYENFADYFRSSGRGVDRFPCSISSSAQSRKNHERYKQIIINAKFSNKTEAVKRIIAQLPVFSQSFSPSPYLDLELFSYDEKWLSSLERPKQCGDFPIRVYGRDSGLLKYEMYCGLRNTPALQPNVMGINQRSLVAFIFHPMDPFAISVQRNNRDYIVNFHMRNPFSVD